MESKIERAPTPGLKEKYRRNLTQMEEAWEMLSGVNEGERPDNLPSLVPINAISAAPSNSHGEALNSADLVSPDPIEKVQETSKSDHPEKVNVPATMDPALEQKIRELECKIKLAPNASFRDRYVNELEKLQVSQPKGVEGATLREPPNIDRETKIQLLASLGKPVTSAPSLMTVNGFGNVLSGMMVDPDLLPKCFMLYGPSAIMPLFPKKAYLLEVGKGSSFRFYREYSFEELREIYGQEKIDKFIESRLSR